jgi:flavin-dependent dehydrogenase
VRAAGERCDVLVVGAGPGGSTAAALFAAAGYDVRLLDRAVFPRFKACGDFLSPGGTRVLRRLGVEEEIRREGARELRGLLVSAHGEAPLRADFEPGEHQVGYALERSRLDATLLAAARRSGADVREGTTAEGLVGPAAVRVRSPEGETAEWRARLVVGAGGRRCPVARDLGVQRLRQGPGRIDLLSHWAGLDVARPYCELHISGPGYTGVASSAPDRVNVNTVVPSTWMRAASGRGNGRARRPRGHLYSDLLRASPAVNRTIENGRQLYEPVASDITPLSTVRASADGALLVGDSALFIDPFTGQGIYLALRSAEMAFEVGAAALAAGDTGAVRLAAYDRLRGAEFAAKVTLSRLLQAIIYSPRAARDVAAALRRDPRGARRLIGLIGDYRPASDLLSPSFLLRLATAGLG